MREAAVTASPLPVKNRRCTRGVRLTDQRLASVVRSIIHLFPAADRPFHGTLQLPLVFPQE